MDVSIIIVNYNTKELTSSCIESVIEHTKNISYEIILVDNKSTDGSESFFCKDKRLLFIQSHKNVGFGKANNLGFEYSHGKYIFLLNSDTLLKNNAVEMFYKAMEKADKNVACMGAILKDEDGNPIKSFGYYLGLKMLMPLKVTQFFSEDSIGESGIVVPVVLGADMFIRRTAIERCGFFDPNFFMYHEENDLQRRFHNSGLCSVIISGPSIIHLEGQSSRSSLNPLMVEGAYTYIKKWNPLWKYLFFKLLFSITRTPKVLLKKCSVKNKWRYLSSLYFYNPKII